MVEIFKHIERFFASITNYLTYNDIFIIFVGLFLFSLVLVIFFTSRSYEARLIKAIDKFNYYFIDNPYLNEDNLVAFNQKMKSNQVPKQLRKHWQQFVLYRENKASAYMSFENCVANPIKNSTYTRNTKMLGRLAWIFSLCALILNCYYCFETIDTAAVLRSVLLTPILILLINLFAQIFLNLRHNAIVSDLYQNYQYFQVNIDKATETLPEYVDYEVLFDKNEIKKGIPILYSYLQKRAEEEKRELERARLKNVEHEKFNFDDQGVAGSLVLERAMQEAENYIAERKKYTQDIGQINADITQEDMNYREITKEYNRQMQVSKETFANFKAQLEEASSTIEANYLKKQQQQELDRQRNLERDFDAATDRHKKIIDSFQQELDTIDKFIAQSRKNLETAMKSEFETYSSKVYDEARKLVDEREKEKHQKLLTNIQNLEEDLSAKKKELDEIYHENQVMSEQLAEFSAETIDKKTKKQVFEQKIMKEQPVYEQPVATVYEEPSVETVNPYNLPIVENIEETPTMSYEEYKKSLESQEAVISNDSYSDDNSNMMETQVDAQSLTQVEPYKAEEISAEQTDDSIEAKPVARRGRPRKVVAETEIKEKKKPGRPRKVQTEETELVEKKKPGRPKKAETVAEVTEKKKPGRPRKNIEETENKPKGKVGRPKKVKTEEEINKPKRGRGRPKKVQETENVNLEQNVESVETEPKKGRGRPRKNTEEILLNDIKNIDEYLKEIDDAIAVENAKLEETQKELAKDTKLRRRKK